MKKKFFMKRIPFWIFVFLAWLVFLPEDAMYTSEYVGAFLGSMFTVSIFYGIVIGSRKLADKVSQ